MLSPYCVEQCGARTYVYSMYVHVCVYVHACVRATVCTYVRMFLHMYVHAYKLLLCASCHISLWFCYNADFPICTYVAAHAVMFLLNW